MKHLLLAIGLAFSISSQAATTLNQDLFQGTADIVSEAVVSGQKFVVGDNLTYKLNLGGFINGTMAMTVKAITATDLVLTQDMDLQFQKQSCEATIDMTNGKMKSLVCNGQSQDPGDQGDIEVVDQKEDTITVPAGTFKCVYIKAKMKKDNSEIEQWLNGGLPITGMAKAIMPSQLGKINLDLSSYKKN